MKLFATRVWGIDPVKWPLATFGTEGICAKLIRETSPGDRLVFIGTKGRPTKEEQRGRILGYFEFGRVVVKSLDVLERDSIMPEAYDKKGVFKWPYAVPLTKAWLLDSPLPDLVETIGRQLERHATTMAVELSDTEAQKILDIPCHEVTIHGSKAYDAIVRRSENLHGGGRSRGPAPSDRQGGSYKTGRQAFTYVMRFGGTNCYKVGYTNDLARRLGELNAHIPYEVEGQDIWKQYLTEHHEDERRAYEMEQRLLDALPPDNIIGERFTCDSMELEVLWAKCLMTLGEV